MTQCFARQADGIELMGTVPELAIDYERRRVTVGGKAVDLTVTEYELLRVLSLEAGRVVTFETLLRRVWARRENADANLVRVFVRDLRRKLGDSAASPTCLFNERGVGYRMAKPRDRRGAARLVPAAHAPPNRMPRRRQLGAPASTSS